MFEPAPSDTARGGWQAFTNRVIVVGFLASTGRRRRGPVVEHRQGRTDQRVALRRSRAGGRRSTCDRVGLPNRRPTETGQPGTRTHQVPARNLCSRPAGDGEVDPESVEPQRYSQARRRRSVGRVGPSRLELATLPGLGASCTSVRNELCGHGPGRPRPVRSRGSGSMPHLAQMADDANGRRRWSRRLANGRGALADRGESGRPAIGRGAATGVGTANRERWARAPRWVPWRCSRSRHS